MKANISIIKYRIARSESSLLQAKNLASIKEWNGVVNRLYYAVFYAVSVLLFNKGYNYKTHSNQKSKFNEIFLFSNIINKDQGGIYNVLYTYRQMGDYADFALFTEDEVSPMINNTEELITEIKKLITNDTFTN